MNKFICALLIAAATFSVQSARADLASLDAEHVDFIKSHHLAAAIDLDAAKHELTFTAGGVPVSFILENGGISTYIKTQDGAVVHTFLKPNKKHGIPEGVELAFNVSIQASPVIEFHRVYGVFELGTIKSDVKSMIANLRSKEWRETTLTLGKMVLCAQASKLPARVGSWLKPVCSE